MDSNLFRKPDSFMEENNVDDSKEGESDDSEVIAEVARQRDQIRLLQNAVEDQSRILREISHQLKKAEAEWLPQNAAQAGLTVQRCMKD